MSFFERTLNIRIVSCACVDVLQCLVDCKLSLKTLRAVHRASSGLVVQQCLRYRIVVAFANSFTRAVEPCVNQCNHFVSKSRCRPRHRLACQPTPRSKAKRTIFPCSRADGGRRRATRPATTNRRQIVPIVARFRARVVTAALAILL